jgi:hypothetical protein
MNTKKSIQKRIHLMKTIRFKELKRLCYCDSKELYNKVFIIKGAPHEWIGIGFVECHPDPEKHVEVTEN